MCNRKGVICVKRKSSVQSDLQAKVKKAGMNVARFNFSHGTHDEHKIKFGRVLKVSGELGLSVATLLDTKGPEIRLRDFEGGRVELKAGQEFTLTTEEIMGNENRATITYKNLRQDVKPGMRILIDDGKIEMEVSEIKGEEILCSVKNGGTISNHKGINVPDAELSMPYVSEVDREDILFGIGMGFDFIAASFVRTKEDILDLKKILDEHKSPMKIIAKIESMQGIRNLREILDVSDGIMVARGDMGVELPPEEVPVIQKKMIKMAVAAGKHVITATQMLESMIHNPRPTRAETNDVANAIYDGTTAIMLSGESAAGKYPVEAVETMARIAERTEQDIDYNGRMLRDTPRNLTDVTTAISYATCTTAMHLDAEAIITVTMSGFTADMVSRYKPESMVIGCSVNPRVCRQMALLWGVTPVLMSREDNTEDLFDEAIRLAKKQNLIHNKGKVVLTAGVPLGVSGSTNMIQVLEV